MAALFNDSKEFVDRPLAADPSTVLEAFEDLPNHSNATLWSFLKKWTMEAGSDLSRWEPPDWVER